MPEGPIGIYVHWPFCQAKCPYCDFNSHVAASIDEVAWREAYLAEIDRYAGEFPQAIVGSVFFGGGTPSLMAPSIVEAVLDRVARRFRLNNDVEVTLEANPTSAEAERFRAYRLAGVSRVSIGLQSLRDTDLKKLGRLHSAAEGIAAFGMARRTFERVSFDLIYARQGQSASDWSAELGEALGMAADHLSLYQLTIESGTAFGRRFAAGGMRGLPDEDLSADLYEMTQEMTATAGLPAYEVSNHAVPGAESRHNLIYWRGGDYVGIGPGAHGRLTRDGRRIATEAVSSPGQWLSRRRAGTHEDRSILSPEDVAAERLIMGLRIEEGLALSELSGIEGISSRIGGLKELGLVHDDPDRLKLTQSGRMVTNAVIRTILA